MPVQIVEFYLHEIPMHLAIVHHLQRVVKDLDVAMIGESEVADNALLFLLQQIVQYAVVYKPRVEKIHCIRVFSVAPTDGVQ